MKKQQNKQKEQAKPAKAEPKAAAPKTEAKAFEVGAVLNLTPEQAAQMDDAKKAIDDAKTTLANAALEHAVASKRLSVEEQRQAAAVALTNKALKDQTEMAKKFAVELGVDMTNQVWVFSHNDKTFTRQA